MEAELDELNDAVFEKQLLEPATIALAPRLPVPAVGLPSRPVPLKNSKEEDELVALQAEMAT